jgi:hypothetical protein
MGETMRSLIRLTMLSGAGALATILATSAANAAVTISSAATSNMSCVSGVCTPTAANAVLNVGDLTTMLGSGNVVVNTGSGMLAQQVQNIVVSASFNWANASSLTLDAYDSVTVNQPVAVNGTGAVVLTTNDGGTDGVLWFGSNGSVSFLGTSNSLTINATPYTLVDSITSLATAIAANAAGSYALAHNYDASADGKYRTFPIPTELTGNVQGLGNTISKLTVEIRGKYSEAGLFDVISGTVDNLRLAAVHFSGYGRSSGGGAFAYYNVGQMLGDTASGVFDGHGRYNWGGLVAYNGGTILRSSAAVQINAAEGAGGIAWRNDGTISLSQTSGKIEGSYFLGGVVGWNYSGVVEQSFSSMTLGGSENLLGGLIGLDYGATSNSYATGAVTGGEFAFVGGLEGSAGPSGTLGTSYSTGAVSGGASSYVGGFLGGEDEQVSGCYWDTTTSGTTQAVGYGNDHAGITGLTTAQLKSGLPAGFDPTIWAERPKINGGLPYLINNPPPKN